MSADYPEISFLSVFKNIKIFVFDMDGVLTDGKLLIMNQDQNETGNPNWHRTMHVRDGYALQLAVKHNYHVLVISGSSAPGVEDRLKRLGIHECFFNVTHKKDFLKNYFREKNYDFNLTLFMGDDIPDEEVMQLCAMAVCPSDAVSEIKEIARYISPFKGGEGCVRDVIETVMKLQGNWKKQTEIPST